MSGTTTYRTCPRSGLQFEAQAEKLMIVNAVAGVVFLLIGGILAVGIVLTRWPAIHWLALSGSRAAQAAMKSISRSAMLSG